MAFTTGRFGVQYHPRDGGETHFLRWIAVGAVALLLAVFVVTKIAKRLHDPKPDKPEPVAAEEAKRTGKPERKALPQPPLPDPPAAKKAAEAPPAKKTVSETSRKTETPAAAAKAEAKVRSEPPKAVPETREQVEARALVKKIIDTMSARPAGDRVLLERLVAAEQQRNTTIAADTILKLYNRPTLADLKDPLLRRLGELNVRQLFSGGPTAWTTTVTVRRGDGRERIAREHRTTSAAVARLNPDVKWEKLKPGDTLRVLDFPNATLVVDRSGYADLSLNNKKGQFFKRYYLSAPKSDQGGVYPIESGASVAARFRELGIKIAPSDRAELEMFLAPGSRIVVPPGPGQANRAADGSEP